MAQKLAVLILTYNEEKNIKACIESAHLADEIVVVDSGSSDRTCEMAEELGAKVIYHAMDEGFAGQRNFALLQTEAEWVMFLDADERITPQLETEIKQAINSSEQYGYEILRRNVVFGQQVNYGGNTPDFSLRLYPRSAIKWRGIVHEQAVVSLPVRKLRSHMLHFTYTSWDRYFFKFNQYTTLMAEEMHKRGKISRLSDILFRPWVAFIKNFILKAGWLDGRIGFILAVFHGFYTMVKYVKLYYLQKETGRQ